MTTDKTAKARNPSISGWWPDILKEALQTQSQDKAAWANVSAAQSMLLAAQEVEQSIKHKHDHGAADQNQLHQSTMNVIEATQEFGKRAEWESARMGLYFYGFTPPNLKNITE